MFFYSLFLQLVLIIPHLIYFSFQILNHLPFYPLLSHLFCLYSFLSRHQFYRSKLSHKPKTNTILQPSTQIEVGSVFYFALPLMWEPQGKKVQQSGPGVSWHPIWEIHFFSPFKDQQLQHPTQQSPLAQPLTHSQSAFYLQHQTFHFIKLPILFPPSFRTLSPFAS